MASSCIDTLMEKQKSQMTIILNWAKSQPQTINTDTSYCSTASINLSKSTNTSVSPLPYSHTKSSNNPCWFLISPTSAENTEANSILDSFNNIEEFDKVIYNC